MASKHRGSMNFVSQRVLVAKSSEYPAFRRGHWKETSIGTHRVRSFGRLRPAGRRVLKPLLPSVDGQVEQPIRRNRRERLPPRPSEPVSRSKANFQIYVSADSISLAPQMHVPML
jgi:hypothetical protein